MMARKAEELEKQNNGINRYRSYYESFGDGSRYGSMRATAGTIHRRRKERRN